MSADEATNEGRPADGETRDAQEQMDVEVPPEDEKPALNGNPENITRPKEDAESESTEVPEQQPNNNSNEVQEQPQEADDQKGSQAAMPNIPDDFCPTHERRQHKELPQRGPLHPGKGANKECGRYGRSLRPSEEECLKRAKRYAMEQSVKFVLQRQQQQQQKQQLDFVKKQQALMLMCRVYVGSIYYEVREDAVRQAFAPFGPIRSVSMTYDNLTNKHKGFAFIEYELPDAAQLALAQMNNAVLGGRNIKVGRPSNMPQAQPIINQLTEEAKNYNRVYISSVHPGLSEQDVRCVFEAFGKVRDCTLVKEGIGGTPVAPPGSHRGYGFIDYEDATSANDAIASMNLFDLGGQLLRVGRAITPPDGLLSQGGFPGGSASSGTGSSLPTASAIAAANVTAKLQAYDVERSPVSSLSAINAQQMMDHAAATGTVLPALMPAALPIVPPPAIIIPPVPSSLTPQDVSATSSPPPPPPAPAVAEQRPEPEPAPPKSAPVVTLTEQQKSLLGITEDSSSSLQDELTVKGREQRQLLMRKLMERQAESRVMILRNMVDAADVDDDLETDINEECSKYGKVARVVISEESRKVAHQGDDDMEGQPDVIIKIFVEFEDAKSTSKAIEAINGRWFAGRLVKADSYDQNLFDMGDYTG